MTLVLVAPDSDWMMSLTESVPVRRKLCGPLNSATKRACHLNSRGVLSPMALADARHLKGAEVRF